VGVGRDEAAFGELEASEHGLGACNVLADDAGVELLAEDLAPTIEGGLGVAVGHEGTFLCGLR
jgi:hypothetical protein